MVHKTLLPTPNYTKAWKNFVSMAAFDAAIKPWPELATTSLLNWKNILQYTPNYTGIWGQRLTAPPKCETSGNTSHSQQPMYHKLQAPPKRGEAVYGKKLRKEQTELSHRTTRISTSNDEFEIFVRPLYKKFQLTYLTKTWKKLPQKIPCQFNDVFDCITPPIPDDELRNQLSDFKNAAMGNVLTIVQNHISKRLDQVDTNLLVINPLDSNKAIVIAKRQIYRNLRKKVNHKDVDQFFEETSKTLGHNWMNKPANTNTPLPSPSL